MYRTVAAMAAWLLATSCASIISGSNYPVSVTSAPDAAHFTISNKKGQVIHSGTTPEVVTLKAGRSYFSAERYDIKFEKEGYAAKSYSLNSSLNGWYFGNILFGGLIGMVIVDPLTGAMYKLPKKVDVPLDGQQSSNDGSLKIVAISALPQELRNQLIPLN